MNYNISSDEFQYNYLNINEKRATDEYYNKIYLSENFSNNTAGAKLLGIDVAKILSSNHEARQKIVDILEIEISKAEESKLINQILETHRNFNYKGTIICLEALLGSIKNE